MSDFLYRQHAGLIAAADALDQTGKSAGFFKSKKSWRELDPISRDEYLGMVYGIVSNYETAFQQAKPAENDPFVNEIVTRFVEEVTVAPPGAYPDDTVAEVNKTIQKQNLGKGADFVGRDRNACRAAILEAFPGLFLEEVSSDEPADFSFRADRLRVWYDPSTNQVTFVRVG